MGHGAINNDSKSCADKETYWMYCSTYCPINIVILKFELSTTYGR